MTKTKESVEKVKDFKAQVGDLLGVNAMVDEDLIKSMKKTLIRQAKEDGEEHIEEVLNAIEKAIEKIKDPEFKAIIASIILVKTPMGTQRACIKEHGRMIASLMAAHMHENIKDCSLSDIAELISAIGD